MSSDIALRQSNTASPPTNRKIFLSEVAPDDDKVKPIAVITPTAAPNRVQDEVSPDSLSYPNVNKENDDDNNLLELEHARWDAQQSAKALEKIVSGIRAVKRILEKHTTDEDMLDDTFSEDTQLVHRLSDELYGVLGSDLLALVNTADMIREHSKLTVQEVSDLVVDVNEAKALAQEADLQAKQARKLGRKLYKENLQLKSEVIKLSQEKRLLVKEVKTLREEAAQTRKFDSWRLLEQHVLGSMAIHEMMIKTPTTPRYNMWRVGRSPGEMSADSDIEPKDSGEVSNSFEGSLFTPKRDKVRDRCNDDSEESASKGMSFGNGFANIRGAFRSRRNNQSRDPKNEIENANQEITPSKVEAPCGESKGTVGAFIGLTSKFRPKSPMPSLGEASSYTDDSATKTPKHDCANTDPDQYVDISQGGASTFPTNVAFDSIHEDWKSPSRLASPLQFQDSSPDGMSIPSYKPRCDPDILRTLAIPSTDRHTEQISPRKRITDSMYEC